jgi:hypothetical protein
MVWRYVQLVFAIQLIVGYGSFINNLRSKLLLGFKNDWLPLMP